MSSAGGPSRCRVVAVVGPTATGKTDLAVQLAQAMGAEVVNADAMSLYRGMDIGTATPTLQERRGVPHHLFDLWDVRHSASVAEYQSVARDRIDGLHRRSTLAVLVGGSGLYLRAAVDDLVFPGTDPTVRQRLEDELEALGPYALHRRLAQVDPRAAAEILPGNGRRVVRALEVVEITGGPFAATLPQPRPYYDAVYLGLDLAADVLADRIRRRVDAMWRRGLVAEVAELIPRGLREGRTASRAVGYRQVLDMLAGECTEEEAREETVRATRRLARRQRAWFRRDPRIHWLGTDAGDRLDEACKLLAPTIEV